MDYEKAKLEIFQMYRDYKRMYAHDFVAGMIYALYATEKINDNQRQTLENMNKNMFNHDYHE